MIDIKNNTNQKQYDAVIDTDNDSSNVVAPAAVTKKFLAGFAVAALALLGAGMSSYNKIAVLETKMSMLNYETTASVVAPSKEMQQEDCRCAEMLARYDCANRIEKCKFILPDFYGECGKTCLKTLIA